MKPERDVKREAAAREPWWQLWRTRGELRRAMAGLTRFIATPETAKHRFFVFLDSRVAPDHSLVAIASSDPYCLGVLSSAVHVTWSLAAGSKLGVGNDPRYNKSVCLDPFPFPAGTENVHGEIAKVAEGLDSHRQAAVGRDETVTMTGMHNVMEKLRSGQSLSAKERKIHELAACGVLKDLHDELDELVAKAYGWEWPPDKEVILERLVALHDERVSEEKTGKVRWLRPEYQIPRFGKDLPLGASELDLDEAAPTVAKPAKPPTDVISQIGAIKKLLASHALAIDEVAAQFSGAKPEIVRRHLQTR